MALKARDAAQKTYAVQELQKLSEWQAEFERYLPGVDVSGKSIPEMIAMIAQRTGKELPAGTSTSLNLSGQQVHVRSTQISPEGSTGGTISRSKGGFTGSQLTTEIQKARKAVFDFSRNDENRFALEDGDPMVTDELRRLKAHAVNLEQQAEAMGVPIGTIPGPRAPLTDAELANMENIVREVVGVDQQFKELQAQ